MNYNCKKWVYLNASLAKEYECTGYVCKTCGNFKYPMFVHTDKDVSSDYTCYKCGADGNLRNICIYCNNIIKKGGNRTQKTI